MAYPDATFLGNQYPATAATEAERRALALKLSAGEILNVFEDPKVNMVDTMIKKFTLTGGKTLRLPVTGIVGAAFHNPGSTLNVTTTDQTEIVHSVDDLLYTALQFPDFYDKMLDYQIRPEYTSKAGYALAQANTVAIFLKLIASARTAAYITNQTFGGARIISDKFKVAAGGATDIAEKALAFIMALGEAQVIMDDKGIPEDMRYVCIKPRDYRDIFMAIQSNGFSLLNKDFMTTPADLNAGVLPMICGFKIMKSRWLPNGVNWNAGKSADSNPNIYFDKGSTAYHTNQHIDASKTFAIIWHPNAVAKLTYMGLQVATEYQLKELSDLFVAYFASGYNVHDPSCAVELALDALDY